MDEQSVKLLTTTLFNHCKEGRVFLDARGRPSWFQAYHLAYYLLSESEKLGIDTKSIDWTSLIDCNLSYPEVKKAFALYLHNFGNIPQSEIVLRDLPDERGQIAIELAHYRNEYDKISEMSDEELQQYGIEPSERQDILQQIADYIKQLEYKLNTYNAYKVIPKSSAPPSEAERRAVEKVANVSFRKPQRLLIKQKLGYAGFVKIIRDELMSAGIPESVIVDFLNNIDEELKTIYESEEYSKLNEEVDRILRYFTTEFMPSRFIVLHSDILKQQGVNVRYPKPIIMFGKVRSPPIYYIRPRFESWINDLKMQGYEVKYEPIQLKFGTDLIVDPSLPLDLIAVAVQDSTLILINADAIGYNIDTINRKIQYYYYKATRLIK